MNRDQGEKLTKSFHHETMKYAKKTPKENGWKYKAFNYNDEEHKEVSLMLQYISQETHLKEKEIIKKLLRNEMERLVNDKRQKMQTFISNDFGDC
jgi:hypothetical protein